MARYESQFHQIEREQIGLFIRLLEKGDTQVDFLLKGIGIEIKGHRTGETIGFANRKNHPVSYAAHAAGGTHALAGHGLDLTPG